MGTGFEKPMGTQSESVSVSTSYGAAADLSVLPEGCVSQIISFTTPRDACKLSLVSPTFCAAAQSDVVWERFLPCDYQDIIAGSRSPTPLPLSSMNKKDLYLALCVNPLIIDEGKRSFWLDKWSGKKCYMLAARDLTIIWGDTPSYWRWISLPESRFEEVAELLLVWWLEIRGRISTRLLSPGTTYAAYLVFKMQTYSRGFGHPPADVSVGIIEGVLISTQIVCLEPSIERRRQQWQLWNRFQILPQPIQNTPLPKKRKDGWFEIKLAEFFCEGGEDELEVNLMEVKGGGTKAGLIVEGIEIRPEGVHQ